jgi:hypothetical protein
MAGDMDGVTGECRCVLLKRQVRRHLTIENIYLSCLIEIVPVEVGFVRFVGDRPLDSPTLYHIKYSVSKDGRLGYAPRESLLGLGP